MGKKKLSKKQHTYGISGCTIKFVSSVSAECVPSFPYHIHTIYSATEIHCSWVLSAGYYKLQQHSEKMIPGILCLNGLWKENSTLHVFA